MLGIPFMDVVTVLAAVLLLGNIHFNCQQIPVESNKNHEIKVVASLLGVSTLDLCSGLMSRTRNIRGELVKSSCSSKMASNICDALAKALYCRTVATIVRRANSLKRPKSGTGTHSLNSNDSSHNDASSQLTSTVGSTGVTDGFIGILDMFGFEDTKPSYLNQLCVNFYVEIIQHLYNTRIFKNSGDFCSEDDVFVEVDADYEDNTPCIDLISSRCFGVFNLLDVECSTRGGNIESFVQKIETRHAENSHFFSPKTSEFFNPKVFGICHYTSKVVYDATDFLEINRDTLPDDVVAVFRKSSCSFGFVTHLFAPEIKSFTHHETVPGGYLFRISPTNVAEKHQQTSTLTQDFCTQLSNLLKIVESAKLHFIRCIRANRAEVRLHFDRDDVMSQIRALQVLETATLMSAGFPHRMRFKAFNCKYGLLVKWNHLHKNEDAVQRDCKYILETFVRILKESTTRNYHLNCNWAIGKHDVFLSEGARQQLENLRVEKRNAAASLIQRKWRSWHLKASVKQKKSSPQFSYQHAISFDNERIQLPYSIFNLYPTRAPPVPPSRSYTVSGNTKMGYPQKRVMKINFKDEENPDICLAKGEIVLVIGTSFSKRGHLVVQHKSKKIHIPYQFMDIKATGLEKAKLTFASKRVKS